jgi:hypothetical protein
LLFFPTPNEGFAAGLAGCGFLAGFMVNNDLHVPSITHFLRPTFAFTVNAEYLPAKFNDLKMFRVIFRFFFFSLVLLS